MRYAGPYDKTATPSFSDLADASTTARRPALQALVTKVDTACVRHAIMVPDVASLPATKLTKAQKATLVDGYDGRSAAVKSLLEKMRKSLAAAHRDLCPYCSLESTSQLDHYLPKARWPEFSLYGPNIMPICPVCNLRKGKRVANAAGERLFMMPTVDEMGKVRVLRAAMAFGPVPRVTYSIDRNAPLTVDELTLVQRHFDNLHLARRFRGRAHSLNAAIKASIEKGGRLRSAARKAISDGYAAALSEEPMNSWRTALYEAIVANAQTFEDWLVA